MQNKKFFGLLVALTIVCLSIVNAVTGHGIKGNTNLNIAVLAKESGSGSFGTWDDEYWYQEKFKEGFYEGNWYDCSPPAGRECRQTDYWFDLSCGLGGSENCLRGPGHYEYFLIEVYYP